MSDPTGNLKETRFISQDDLIAELQARRPHTTRVLSALLDRYLSTQTQLHFFREMVFRSADAIAITGRAGRLLLVNSAFSSLLGTPMEAVLGEPIAEVAGLESSLFEAIAEQLSRGEALPDYEYILQREGHPARVLSISVTPLLDPTDGTFNLAVVVARDVTGRWELERQVAEWQQRARQYLYALHPPEIAEAMVEGRVEARNLNVSVLFTDVTGFTRFSAQVPPAEVAAALHQYFTGVSQVVLEHQGWVDKFIGDSVMALFGIPGGSADHARRALEAAAGMGQVLKELSLPWRHKIGVASGQVIAGDIGSLQKPTYTAIGDAVNLASRLTAMARPGEILVCPTTHHLAGDDISYEDLGDLDVRGYGSCQVFRLLSV